MHVTVLSGGSGWHVQDLRRAAALLGIELAVLDFRKVRAGVNTATALPATDRVLVRTMPPGSLEQVVFRMDVLHRWRVEGVPVLNPPAALEACVDKYLASARLAQAGILTPPTIVCQNSEHALEAFRELGGDVVVKPLFGSEGRGMVRVNDGELAWRTFRTLERTGAVLYLQQFIPHQGSDLRAFVLGGEVVAAIRRTSDHDWRTNIAQGARAESVHMTTEETQLALRAAVALGAPACGVDLLPDISGNRYVLEVNAVPGWRALAPATGTDIADLLLRYLVHEYS